MTSPLRRSLAAAAVAGAALAFATAPADAGGPAIATSVELNADADCEDASLDIGMDMGTIDTEIGHSSLLDGTVMEEFSNSSGFSDSEEVFEGYGIDADGDLTEDGTVIGTYASIGLAPLTAATAAEWFVLYQCSEAGENLVLYSCFGDLGDCPATADVAEPLVLAPAVDDDAPDPGQTITATADCPYSLGGALLFDGDTSLGGDSAEVVDGSFTVELTVPADIAPGTELTVRFDCGEDLNTILSASLPVTVAGATAAPAPAPEPVPAAPDFTG